MPESISPAVSSKMPSQTFATGMRHSRASDADTARTNAAMAIATVTSVTATNFATLVRRDSKKGSVVIVMRPGLLGMRPNSATVFLQVVLDGVSRTRYV